MNGAPRPASAMMPDGVGAEVDAAGRAGRWWPLLVYACAVAVVLGPSLVGARVALPHDLLLAQLPWSADAPATQPANPELRDTLDFYYPVQHALVAELRSGRFPVWLPDVHLGVAGAQFVGWGLWSPFKLLPALVLPFDLAWSWAQALVLLAAMLGAHVLAREIGVPRWAAVIAGLSYGLSGFVTGWLGWPHSDVAALVPFVLWATRRTVVAGGLHGPLVLAPLTALLWLAGFPAVAVFALIAAAVVALHAALARPADGTEGAEARPRLIGLLAAAVAVLLGTAAAGAVLVPSVSYLEALDLGFRSTRGDARILPLGLLTFVVPGLFGDMATQVWWFPAARVETVAYAGVVTLLLGAAAWLFAPRRSGVWLWSGLTAGFLALSYGAPPLRALVRATPVLSENPPSRAVVIACLGIALLGALGADALARRLEGLAPTSRAGALGLSAAGVIGATAAVWLDPLEEIVAVLQAHPGPLDLPALALFTAKEGLLAIGLVAGAAAGLALVVVLTQGQPARRGRAGAAVLVAVVALDMLLFATGWNVQVPRAGLFPDAPGLSELAAAAGPEHRVAGSAEVGLPNTHLVTGWADIRSHALLSRRQYEVLERMGAVFHSRTRWDLDALASTAWDPWLSALGVAAVLTPAEIPAIPAGYPQDAARVPVPVAPDPPTRAALVVERAGDLTAVLLRLATYGGTTVGDLRVEISTPAGGRTTTVIPEEDQADNGLVTIPLIRAPVEAGDRVLVALTSTTPGGTPPPSVWGTDAATPAVGAVIDAGTPWETEDLGPVRIHRNPRALPRVQAVARAEAVEPGEALQRVADGAPEDLTDAAFVELPEGASSAALPTGGRAALTGATHQGGRVRATVRSTGGALVVVREAAQPGWVATIDGRPTEVLTANHLFLGVPVPPGRHEVVLRYVPPGLRAGLGLSASALLALAVWVLALTRRRRTRDPRTSETPTAAADAHGSPETRDERTPVHPE